MNFETALLTVVRSRLVSALELDDDRACSVEIDSQLFPPLPAKGQVCIVPGSWRSGSQTQPQVIELTGSFSVWVCERITDSPRAKRGERIFEIASELNRKLDVVTSAIHGNLDLMLSATQAQTGNAGTFTEAAFLESVSPAQTYDASVMDAMMGQGGDPVLGVRRELVFSGAKFWRAGY